MFYNAENPLAAAKADRVAWWWGPLVAYDIC